MKSDNTTRIYREPTHRSTQKLSRSFLLFTLLTIALCMVFVLFGFVQNTTAKNPNAINAGTICGTKFHDLNGNGVQDPGEPGIEGWQIFIEGTGFNASPVTDVDGNYCVDGIPNGEYIVSEQQESGWVQTYPPGEIYEIIIDDQVVEDVDFGNWEEPTGIHGAKWLDMDGDGIWDSDEPGLPGWVIQLEYEDGTIYTTTTEDNGRYWFVNLPGGSYTLTEVMQPGWTQTFPIPPYHTFVFDPAQAIEHLDFGNMPDDDGSIHGTKWHDQNGNGVWDNGEPPLSGWTIWLEGEGFSAETETDVDGNYWFMGLPPGEYIIREVLQTGWVLTFPADGYHTIQLGVGEVIEDVDFGNWDPPADGSIHGHKWHDQNGNGVWDNGEPPLSGWSILLSHNGLTIASTATNANGEYWFMNLLPGEYVLSEDISGRNGPQWNGSSMQQWVQTFPDTGTHTVNLASGETIVDIDFGNWQNGSDDFCMIPWDNHFLNEVSLDTEVYIFNTSNTDTYSYTVQMFGPTTFNILTPLPVTLSPVQYGVVDVQVDYPPLFNAPHQSALFGAVVTNLDTGTSFTCSAALWSYSPNWWTNPNVNSGLAGGIPPGFTQAISFTVQHNGPMGMMRLPAQPNSLNAVQNGNASYTIYAMSRGMTETIVSLNGMAPGEPVTGELAIPFDTSVDIPVDVAYTDMNLLAQTDIVFELDVTGDGNPDMVTSYLAIAEPHKIFLPVIVKN